MSCLLSEEADRWVRFLEEKIGLETKGTSLGIEMADEISGNLSRILGRWKGMTTAWHWRLITGIR